MTELLLVLATTALVNNVVLSQFLGLCPFLGVSRQIKTAAGMGGAVIFVITISSALTWTIDRYILEPLDLVYLRTIVFILVIAALVQLVEIVLKKALHSLYQALGVYLALITTNCAVLGVSLTNVQQGNDFLTSVVTGFGTSVGFALAILLLAGVRERIEHNDILKSFRGMPIVLLTAGLMAMAFFGFKGLI